jgi:hypothetical protein
MYYVINLGYSRRLLVPMTDKSSATVKELFDCTYAEERYVQGVGQVYDVTDDFCQIEVMSDETIDDKMMKGTANPRPE